MTILSTELDPRRWAEVHFADLDLGDVRRNARAITVAQAMAAKPGEPIPQLFDRWSEVKAAYTFFARPEATPDQLQTQHRELVREAVHEPGTYLLAEDTTEMSWAGGQGRAGLGPIGSSKEGQLGFLLHSVLAVGWPTPAAIAERGHRPPVEILGLADQQSVVRQPRPAGEARRDHAARLRRARESQLWERATRRLGPAPDTPAVRWVRVCDRGADIYEFLHGCLAAGHGFVVRAVRDRVLVDGPSGKGVGRLFATARAQRSLGEFALALRSRAGQPARTAHLSVSAVRVWLRSPQRPGHAPGSLAPIACTAVRVWEAQPPPGVEPLEWVLLCDTEVRSFAQAQECAWQYATRWLLEEFHKALKTGMGAERLQLEAGEALMAAVAMQSVVAVRLLAVRETARQEPEAPASESGLDPGELAVLALKTGRHLTTVREVALALGRLGGHLNRKGDGLPGWLTLWRGYLQLQVLVEGVRLAHKLKKFR